MVSNRKDGQYHLFVAEDGFTMCDYSLHHVVSRPARVGDKLVSTGFSRSGTRGFAAIGEPNVAVCLLPGTEVAFEAEAQYEHSFDRLMPGLRFGFVGESLARFRQVNMERPLAHHDAEAMARDRAAVRQSVEQLAAGQEQMARDIARVQPAEQDIRHKISVALPATSRCPGAQARADATTGTSCAADFSAAARAAAAIPAVAQAVVGGRSCASG
jgi:hypothetical protein